MTADEELEPKGGLQHRLDRHSYDRLIILSDGVFAIAITLAAFEIKVPNTWHDLAGLWSQLKLPISIYFLSFFLVASYWNSQRTLFARLLRVDTPFMVLALLQLLFVALIPVATELFYGQIKQPAAMSIYCVTLAACGYATAALWGYAALHPALVHAESRARDYWERFFNTLVEPLILTWFAATSDLSRVSIAGAAVLLLVRRVILWRLKSHANLKDTKTTIT